MLTRVPLEAAQYAPPGRSIFWPESFALGFFAWSWPVKGQAIRSIKSTLGEAKEKIAK